MFTSHLERNMLGMETIQFQRSHFLVHFFTISRLGGGWGKGSRSEEAPTDDVLMCSRC